MFGSSAYIAAEQRPFARVHREFVDAIHELALHE